MSPRILDRPTFHAVLADTRAATDDVLGDHTLQRHIADQLTWMALRTEDTTIPDEVDAAAIELGPLSLRLDAPLAYRRALQELDHGFRRYGALGARFDGPPGAPARRGIVQVRFGRQAFTKRILDLDDRLVIGGDERAALAVREDGVASRHAELWWTGTVGMIRALGQAPLTVHGQAARRGELKSGDVFELGDAVLRFFVEAFSPPRAPVAAHEGAGVALAMLTSARDGGELYAVVDAARDRRILTLLEEAVDPHVSLYEGERARGLDGVAPYLVRFTRDSHLLERLVEEGWGRAWGIFLVSRGPTKMVRRSLRRLLMVAADTRRDALYFRFYDPRALARFAPLATVRQRSELLAEAEAIVYEDDTGCVQQLRREEAP